MDDIAEQPSTFSILENNPRPYRAKKESLAGLEIDSLRDLVRRTRNELIERRPDISSQIEAVYGLLYNAFLWPKEHERLSTPEKVVAAGIQHNIVHNAYYAGTSEASDNFVTSVYNIVETTDWLAGSFAGKGERLPLIYWSGVKGELGVAKALKNSGYFVCIPSYTSSSNPAPINEVLQMDVLSGVDMIAYQSGSEAGFLIDVKSRVDAPPVLVESNSGRRVENFLVRRVIEKIGLKKVFPVRVTICGRNLFFERRHRSDIVPVLEQRGAMQRFCDMGSEVENGLCLGLAAVSRQETGKYAKRT